MSRARGFSGLTWVSGELGLVIREARDALERYMEDEGDNSTLASAVAHLSQVRGVLQMLHLSGAARLAEEMQASATAILEAKVKAPQDAAEPLMLALILLPDYIEKLESTDSEDLPSLLLTTINDLRRSRGASILQESDLALADLIQSMAMEQVTEDITGALQALAMQVRPRLHKGLLTWVRGPNPAEGVRAIGVVFGELAADAKGAPLLQGVLRAAQAVAVGIAEGSIAESKHVKGLIGRVDRNIKELAEQGLKTAVKGILPEQFQDLLRLIAGAMTTDPLINAVQTDYGLARIFPSEVALADGQRWMAAPSADALSGVRSAAVKELLPIKDTLDMFMRGGCDRLSQLLELATPVQRLANTLEMVGLGELSQRLNARASDIKAMGDGHLSPDDTLLMSIASDLLFVESSLNNVGGSSTTDSLIPSGEMRNLVVRTLKEAALDMTKAKDAIIAYMETPGNLRALENTPTLFHGIAGALRVISHTDAANLLDQIRKFIQSAILSGSVRADQRVLETLAESIAAIEYYMEAVADGRGDADNILDIASRALQRLLSYGGADELTVRPPFVQSGTPLRILSDEDTDETQDIAAVSTEALTVDVAGPSIDPEILEIFLEEAKEAAADLQQAFERWSADNTDNEALTALRRSFHTLKGSGRIAGALEIGEFAWSVENLLNRVIDHTIGVSSAVHKFVAGAVEELPGLIHAQESGSRPKIDLIKFARSADELLGKSPVPGVGDNASLSIITTSIIPSVATHELTPISHPQIIMENNKDASAALILEPLAHDDIWVESAFENKELRDIFELESRQHLETIDTFLHDCEEIEPPYAFGKPLTRAFHTLAGSAHMAGVGAIAVLAKAMERKLEDLLGKKLGAERDFLELIREAAGNIRNMIVMLGECETIPVAKDLIARIEHYEVRDLNLSTTGLTKGYISGEPADAIVTEHFDISSVSLQNADDTENWQNLDSLWTSESSDSVSLTIPNIDDFKFTLPDDYNNQEPESAATDSDNFYENLAASSNFYEERLYLPDDIDTTVSESSTDTFVYSSILAENTTHNNIIASDVDEGCGGHPHVPHFGDTTATHNTQINIADNIDAFHIELPKLDTSEIDIGKQDWGRGDTSHFAIDLNIDLNTHTSVEPVSIDLIDINQINIDQIDTVQVDTVNIELDEIDVGGIDFSKIDFGAISIEKPGDGSTNFGENDDTEQIDFGVIDLNYTDNGELFAFTPRGAAPVKSEPTNLAQITQAEVAPVTEEFESLNSDQEIYEIFLEEARELLEKLHTQLSEWKKLRANPKFSGQIKAVLHTLKGGARLIGIQSIGTLAQSLETLIESLTPEVLSTQAEVLVLVQKAADALMLQLGQAEKCTPIAKHLALLKELKNTYTNIREVGGTPTPAIKGQVQDVPVPVSVSLIAPTIEPLATDPLTVPTKKAPKVEAFGKETQVRNVGNAPAPTPPIIEEYETLTAEAEVQEIFLEEAQELLEQLDDLMRNWISTPADASFPGKIKRVLHTVKGGARLAGIQSIGTLSHTLETLLEGITPDILRAHPSTLTLAQKAVDSLSTQADQARNGGPVAKYVVLLNELTAVHVTITGKDKLKPKEVGGTPTPPIREVGDAPTPTPPIIVPTTSLTIGTASLQPEQASPTIIKPLETVPTPPQITEEYEALIGDPELQEIFTEEANDLLGKLDGLLRAWIAAPNDANFPGQIKRILHTLKGGARLAGIQSIGTLSHTLETLLEGLTPEFLQAHGGILPLAQRAADRLAEQIDQVRTGGPVTKFLVLLWELENAHSATIAKSDVVSAATAANLPETAQITTKALIPQAPSATVEEYEGLTAEPEIKEIFLEESKELLEQLDNRLREWITTPTDPSFPSQIKRVLHTLKGGARLAGINAIGNLSHTLETLLDGLTPQLLQIHSGVLGLAQRAMDRLAEQVDQVRSGGPITKFLALLEELEHTHALVMGKQPPVKATPELAIVVTNKPQPQDVAQTTQPTKAAQPQQEQVRIRADLLNKLIGYAGEINIQRARLEQHNNVLGFNLTELNQTVARLHGQLRNMAVETEAQIRFRKGDNTKKRNDPKYEETKKNSDATREDNTQKISYLDRESVENTSDYNDRNSGGGDNDPKEGAQLEEQLDLDPLELDRFSNIQLLSRSLAETVNDLQSIRDLLGEQYKSVETLLIQHTRTSNDLQDGLLRTRMVPFSQTVQRLSRLVRQTAEGIGKKAELVVTGAEGEMDRNILERMIAPLEHILRNAIGHGIEKPEGRQKAQKNPIGRITIAISRERNEVLLTVSDDGNGLNLPAIRKRAIERGLLNPGVHMDDNDVMQLILEPGFSTAEAVTQLSGRGVGTDVVVSEVKQLGGSLEISSKAGQGTTFSIRLPFTLAITQAMLVKLENEVFAIPHSTMEGVVRISPEELERCYNGKQSGYNYAGYTYSVRYLGALLGTKTNRPHGGKRSFPHILVRSSEHRVAIQVDGIIGNSQIVMKSVGPQLSNVRWISGGTIMVDGRVALILDVSALVRIDVVQTMQKEVAVKTELERPILAMVVDDSIIVRKVTERILRNNKMNVITAKDGMDALAQLQEQQPDVVLLDVEMPRMDGYELARHMRSSPDERIKRIPIVMITSRIGEKHREIGLSLGVKRYLGKPFQEGDLLNNIHEVLEEVKAEA